MLWGLSTRHDSALCFWLVLCTVRNKNVAERSEKNASALYKDKSQPASIIIQDSKQLELEEELKELNKK